MGDRIRDLLDSVVLGDQNAFPRLLSEIEKVGAKSLKYQELLEPSHLAFRIGVTGPPGAGKSTLIDCMISEISEKGFRVGVLAVDPSSPFTQGAILGDRVRYVSLETHSDVFVRSVGSRGSLGGLCAQAYLMLRAFDFAKFDVVLIETVGVGQTELEIMNVSDHTSVVLVPESGDGIQAMKAGLMEIADLFVVNKSDRAGADSLVKELEWISDGNVDVLQTSAINGSGIREFVNHLINVKSKSEFQKVRWSVDRLKAEAVALLRLEMERDLLKNVSQVSDLKSLQALFGL